MSADVSHAVTPMAVGLPSRKLILYCSYIVNMQTHTHTHTHTHIDKHTHTHISASTLILRLGHSSEPLPRRLEPRAQVSPQIPHQIISAPAAPPHKLHTHARTHTHTHYKAD